MFSRRAILTAGGGLAAALSPSFKATMANEVIEIRMEGRDDGTHVWFDPIGVLIKPGQMIRWINLNPGNSHTATAYHPANFERPLRIPKGAKSWNSDYLLPNESFSVFFAVEGIYDYFCIPHEHAGMVGRVVVGEEPGGWAEMNTTGGDLPEEALKAFPTVEEIMTKRIVRRG